MKTLAITALVAGLSLSELALSGAMTGTPAEAADLGGVRPVRPPDDFAPPLRRPLDLERWTGFYLGGALGYGFGDGRTDGNIGNLSFDQSGALGTILAGYNWQLGSAVLGLEADIGTGGLSSSTPALLGTLKTELNAMGSFRARAGVLMTPALMLYATGGLAWANMDIGYAGLEHKSNTFIGYQIGAGSELMISRNVTLRLEYIYTDLQRETLTHSGQANAFDPDFHTVRAGISLKF